MRIVVTGAAGVLGRRVVERLSVERLSCERQIQEQYKAARLDELDEEEISGEVCGEQEVGGEQTEFEIVAIDKREILNHSSVVVATQADMETSDIGELFLNADVVVHLASTVRASSSEATDFQRESALFRKVLAALEYASVSHFVMISSAMVYGARADNPVPMTEDFPVRPNSDFRWAIQRSELEQIATDWANATGSFRREPYQSQEPHHSDERVLSVLRPTAIVAEGQPAHLTSTLWATKSNVAAKGEPPVQYIHVDDIASAVVSVVSARYDGIVNVAPDGWIPPEGMADLEGFRLRLQVPTILAKTVNMLRSHWGAPTHPGAVPYTVHPWVVSNDTLKGLGWRSAYSNEEAWMVAYHPKRWETLSPIRKQEVRLLISGSVALSAVALIIWVLFKVRCQRGYHS